MSEKKLKPLVSAAHPSSLIGQLQIQAKELNQLNIIFQSALPEFLVNHVALATIRDGLLVAFADSPIWATNMRYEIPSVLAKLRQLNNFPEINQIKLIQSRTTDSGGTSIKKEQTRLMSESVRDLLTKQASTLKNEKLQNALKKLTKHANKI
jgi:hypothetical protein